MGEPPLPEGGRRRRGSRELSLPYFSEAGVPMTPDDRRASSFSRRAMPMASGVGRSARPGPGAARVSVRLLDADAALERPGDRATR